MDNRLKQIWSGFKETTNRHLTDAGVDKIVVPHRVDYRKEDEAALPEGFDAPAEAAFAALRETLKKHEKKFAGKKRSASTGYAADGEPAPMAARTFDGEELIKGLRATAMRTERADRDYSSFLSSNAGKAILKKHKKKRFGIF